MYNSYFNLDENPFSIAPDPRFLYMSEQHREALAHLMYALKTAGGFVLLTGEVGTGKTTVCRCLLEQLPGDLNVAFVLNPKLTAGELLATVCDELRIDYPADTTSNKLLVDSINRYLLAAHAAGRKTVLIIDEAQNLSPDVLEQIRLLTNLETTQRKLLQVVMLGQPELRDLLARPELRQLSQRITARYHLGPLSRTEVAAYINHRLSVAGHRHKLFGDPVIEKVYRYTGGIPRLINVLCDRALLGTYVQGLDKVSAATVKSAAREVLSFDTPPSSKLGGRGFRLTLALLLGILAGSGLTAVWLDLDGPPDNSGSASQTPGAATTGEAPPFIWPKNLDPARSRDQAFTHLFRLWGLEVAGGTDPCTQATASGLACLSRQGNLGSLLRLNRPAVLTLLTPGGEEIGATLSGIDRGLAKVLLGNQEVRMTTSQLESFWNGIYTIFWRPPAGFDQAIRLDREGPARDWLTARFADLTGRQPAGADLARAVKEYQQGEGLLADGIAGPETIIHLNTSTGQPVALLSRN
jgi:general secretion pathway protein A